MKQYPVYKPESKLPGVTEVPAHWKIIRNSVSFREVSETGYGNLDLSSILSDRGVIKQSETGRKEIELIQEYRTTFISGAVTGKIDVRDTLERGAAPVVGGI